MHWPGYGFGWGWMIIGGLMMLLFWGGLIALCVWLIRSFASRGDHLSDTNQAVEPDAREILDRRYAGGEINREEYMTMKEDLI
jgi:putative membrane protein